MLDRLEMGVAGGEEENRMGSPWLIQVSLCDSNYVCCCVCMHTRVGAFGGWVWFWAAVLEMASELGGGWDSPDRAGSLRGAGWCVHAVACAQENRFCPLSLASRRTGFLGAQGH